MSKTDLDFPLVLQPRDEGLFRLQDYLVLLFKQAASIAFKGSLGSNPLGAIGPFLLVAVSAFLSLQFGSDVLSRFGVDLEVVSGELNEAVSFILLVLSWYVLLFIGSLVTIAPFRVWRDFPAFAKGEVTNLRRQHVKREQKKLLISESNADRDLKIELFGVVRRNLYPAISDLSTGLHLAVRAAVTEQLAGRLPEFSARDVCRRIFGEINEISRRVDEPYVQAHSFQKVCQEIYLLTVRYKEAISLTAKTVKLNEDMDLVRWERELPIKLQSWSRAHGRCVVGIDELAKRSGNASIEQLAKILEYDVKQFGRYVDDTSSLT